MMRRKEMREIKFRAWNDIDKMLIDWGVLRASPVFFMNIIKGVTRHHKLMQFTGLTDNNGVEIYEGDIVEDEEHYYSVISWDNGDSMYIASDVGGLADMCHPVKVIGNIHENSDLLESC